MRSSRSLLFLATRRVRYASQIRPTTQKPPSVNASSADETPLRSPGTGGSKRWGLLFLLGGLAAATWFAKPNKRQPSAALDSFKPRVAVVFVLGSSNGAAEKFASKYGFGYASEPSEKSVADLVKTGHTKLIIDNVDPKIAGQFEEKVVACDAALNYTGHSISEFAGTGRLIDMANTTIDEALTERNLV